MRLLIAALMILLFTVEGFAYESDTDRFYKIIPPIPASLKQMADAMFVKDRHIQAKRQNQKEKIFPIKKIKKNDN